MNSNKINARLIGALFIITTVAGMIDAYSVAPILTTPLANFFPHAGRMTIGALMILIMSIGIVGIAVLFFPVIRKQNETVAITYVSFRTIECVLLLAGSIIYLFLIALSQEFLKAGSPTASDFPAIAALAIKIRYAAFQIAMVILGIGSVFLCWVLFRSKLIPQFIALVGIMGYALLFASAFLDLLGIIDTVHGLGSMLYIPGGLFELVLLPVWLLIKGFKEVN